MAIVPIWLVTVLMEVRGLGQDITVLELKYLTLLAGIVQAVVFVIN
jgi:hypothetical protein